MAVKKERRGAREKVAEFQRSLRADLDQARARRDAARVEFDAAQKEVDDLEQFVARLDDTVAASIPGPPARSLPPPSDHIAEPIPLRDLVIVAMAGIDDRWLTPTEVFERALKLRPGLPRRNLYNALYNLAATGVVSKVGEPGRLRYQLAQPHSPAHQITLPDGPVSVVPRRRGTIINLSIELLRDKGKPMHVTEIAALMAATSTTVPKLHSLVGMLGRASRKTDGLIVALGGNRFGLREWSAATNAPRPTMTLVK